MPRQAQTDLKLIPTRSHQTQWATQFAVASELCKRGYEIAFTSGQNTPLADLMAVSPQTKQMFLVDVKGLYRHNPFLIKLKAPRKNLFYILVYVPTDGPNEFFVLSQREAARINAQRVTAIEAPA